MAAEVRLGFAYVENSTLRIEGLQVYMSATHEIFSKREWSAKKTWHKAVWSFRNEYFCVGIESKHIVLSIRPYCKVPNADMVR